MTNGEAIADGANPCDQVAELIMRLDKLGYRGDYSTAARRTWRGRQNETKAFTARHHRYHQLISIVCSRTEESANRLADVRQRPRRTALRAADANQCR